MNQLPKLVAHCTWATRAWLQFIVDKAASGDWLLRRLSHIMLGERAWFQRRFVLRRATPADAASLAPSRLGRSSRRLGPTTTRNTWQHTWPLLMVPRSSTSSWPI